VTADGRIREASRTVDADLFWALRGAGANFGVVTRFTFRLHEVGPTVYGGLIAWPFERAAEILAAYRDITSTSPRELTVFLNLLRAPPAPFVPEAWHGRRIAAMCVCYSGDLDRVDEVLAPIRALADPVVDLLAEQPYTVVQSYLDDGEPRGQHYYWKTELLAGLDDGLLATLAELFADCPVPDGQIGLLQIGGALNDHDADDGSVGNRDARFAIGLLGMWDPGDPDEGGYLDWIRDASAEVRPFSTGAAYINFQTADEDAGRIRAAYGPNHERLVELKQRFDPDNQFRVNRNLTP
jgi:FAD/FMN-containing dehydrogenase